MISVTGNKQLESLEEILVLCKIQLGLDDVKANNTLSFEEFETETTKWLA